MNMKQSNKDGIEFVLVVSLILGVVTYYHLDRFWIAVAILAYLGISTGLALWQIKRAKKKKAQNRQV